MGFRGFEFYCSGLRIFADDYDVYDLRWWLSMNLWIALQVRMAYGCKG